MNFEHETEDGKYIVFDEYDVEDYEWMYEEEGHVPIAMYIYGHDDDGKRYRATAWASMQKDTQDIDWGLFQWSKESIELC